MRQRDGPAVSYAGPLSALFVLLVLGMVRAAPAIEWPVTTEHILGPIQSTPSRCPRSFKPYTVVVAGTRHDAQWTTMVGEDVESLVYQQEDSAKAHFYPHSGNEAAAYIQFIVDFYDCLPNVTAFVHGHEEEGWHNMNMRQTFLALQWDRIPGYTDLNRKVEVWEVQLKNRPKYPSDHPIASGDDVFSGKYHPFTIMGGDAYDAEETFHWLQQEANAHAYDKFFGLAGLGAMPHRVKFVCCSQFAVTRERIQRRSRDFWLQNLHYMQHNDIQGSNLKPKSHIVGDIWTVYWPMIFGESADYERVIPDHELFLR